MNLLLCHTTQSDYSFSCLGLCTLLGLDVYFLFFFSENGVSNISFTVFWEFFADAVVVSHFYGTLGSAIRRHQCLLHLIPRRYRRQQTQLRQSMIPLHLRFGHISLQNFLQLLIEQFLPIFVVALCHL